MRHSFLGTCGVFLSAAMLLSACDVTTPSQVKTGEIRIMERMKTATLDARRVDANRVDMIADDYKMNGRGDFSVVVSYLQNDAGAKRAVSGQGIALRNAFAAKGISDLNIDYVPVTDTALAGQAVVSYQATVAEPPENCGQVMGYQGADVLRNMDAYELGCGTQSALSKMIVQPEDLLGTSGTPDGDSRRHGALVERYKSGTPNEKLEGMNASEVGE